MNDSTKGILGGSAAVVVVALLFTLAILYRPVTQAPVVFPQVATQSGQSGVVVQPLVVMPSQQPSEQSGQMPKESFLGGLVHNTQEIFSAGLLISGGNGVSSTNAVLNGNVTSTAVPTTKTVAVSASASSQVLCSARNTTGQDRVLSAADLIYATSSVTGGNYRITLSQSATLGATGTASNLFYDETFAAPTNGINSVTPTSTLNGTTSTNATKVVWYTGNYVQAMIASPTTTLQGFCKFVSN